MHSHQHVHGQHQPEHELEVEEGWQAAAARGQGPDLTGGCAAGGSALSAVGSTHASNRTAHAQDCLPLQLRLMRRVEQAVTLFSLLLQLALYWRNILTLTAAQHVQQLAVLAIRSVGLLASACLPLRLWLRYRVVLIAIFRLSIAAMPSQRTAQEGDAVLLAKHATPGPVGAVQDLFRLLTGTRLLPMALIGASLIQPPLAVLAQQAVLMALTSDNPAFCSTPLLTHPIMQGRLAAAWAGLEAWARLLAPLAAQGAGVGELPEPLQRQLHCAAVLGWLQGVVGVLLPTLVAAWTAPAVGMAGGESALCTASAEEGPAPGSACSLGSRRHRGSRAGRALRIVTDAVWRIDATQRDCCRAAGGSPLGAATLCAACCLLAANLYALARAAAVRAILPAVAVPA